MVVLLKVPSLRGLGFLLYFSSASRAGYSASGAKAPESVARFGTTEVVPFPIRSSSCLGTTEVLPFPILFFFVPRHD